MKASILLVPIPRVSVTLPNQQREFAALFKEEAPRIISYSNQIKSEPPNLNAYRHYIAALNERRGSPLQSVFSNPFNKAAGNQAANMIEAEMVNSMWNFVSDLMSYMMTIDASDLECLKSMKIIIMDLKASAECMKEVVVDSNHPFISPAAAQFVDSYVKYVADYWQLCIVQLQKENAVPRPAVRCLEDIKVCEEMVKSLTVEIRTYFKPILEGLKRYLNLLVRYQLGKNAEAKLEIGEAISYYSNGYEISKLPIEDVVFAPQLMFAIKIVQNNTITAINTSKKNNKAVYWQSIPEMPELPPPSAPAPVQAGQSLFVPPDFSQQPSSPSQNPPNFPQNPPNFPQNPPNFPQNPPVFTQNFTQQQNPPVFTPKGQNSSFPPSEAPNGGFPEWEELKRKREIIWTRVESQSAKTPEICGELKSQLEVAAKNDELIEKAVKQFIEKPGPSRAPIEQIIQQAALFYTQMEQRVYTLESSGE